MVFSPSRCPLQSPPCNQERSTASPVTAEFSLPLKLVLNTTSWSLHEASQSFKILRRRVITRPKTVFQHSDVSQFSACEEMFRNTLPCSWLRLIGWFGLPHNADVTSLSERPTDHGTLCSTSFFFFFIPPSCFDLCNVVLKSLTLENTWQIELYFSVT